MLMIVAQFLEERATPLVTIFGPIKIKFHLNNLVYQMNLKKIMKTLTMVQ